MTPFRYFIFVLLASIPIHVSANGGGAADMLNLTQTPQFKNESKPVITLKTKCTDENGVMTSQGEPGYEACISKARLKKLDQQSKQHTQNQ